MRKILMAAAAVAVFGCSSVEETAVDGKLTQRQVENRLMKLWR